MTTHKASCLSWTSGWIKFPNSRIAILEGAGLANGLRERYFWCRDAKEYRNFKGHIIRQSVIKVWNSTKGITNPTISPPASSPNTFRVGAKYSKKHVMPYADMVHSGSMSRLKTQQELHSEGWNIPPLMYLQIAGGILRKKTELETPI